MTLLTPDIANRFAGLTLSHLGREYPFKMDLVLTGRMMDAAEAERVVQAGLAAFVPPTH